MLLPLLPTEKIVVQGFNGTNSSSNLVVGPYRSEQHYSQFDCRGTSVGAANGTSNWLAGLRLDAFEGTAGVQIARAASAIDADILSPSGVSDSTPVVDPTMEGFIYFTTEDMISEAHKLGMEVKPWTVSL